MGYKTNSKKKAADKMQNKTSEFNSLNSDSDQKPLVFDRMKNKEGKKVPQPAEFVFQDYDKFSYNNYINLSIGKNHAVECAAIAQPAEYLPDEQESSKTSGFEPLARIPAAAPT